MSSTEPASLIPATLLTGFLGSGKTTVLNHVLKQPGMVATAVIINEFGEIGLDHLLVERSSEDVVLLNSGCGVRGPGQAARPAENAQGSTSRQLPVMSLSSPVSAYLNHIRSGPCYCLETANFIVDL
jgi:CobW/HypB/UreG, nucleotide-binding domain